MLEEITIISKNLWARAKITVDMTMTAELYADINNRRVYFYLDDFDFLHHYFAKRNKITKTKKGFSSKISFLEGEKVLQGLLLLNVALTLPKHAVEVSISGVKLLLYASRDF